MEGGRETGGDKIASVPRSFSVNESTAQQPLKRFASQGIPNVAAFSRVPESESSNASKGARIGDSGPMFYLIGSEGHAKPRKSTNEARKSTDHATVSSAWSEASHFFQKLGSRRVSSVFGGSRVQHEHRSHGHGFGQGGVQRKDEFPTDYPKPNRWKRLLRKLGLDSRKKVHAARAEWLNYDSQSYAMNFEEKGQEPLRSYHSQPLPKISGPGAREIVTVLLQRSSSANRNSGTILIPRPVNSGRPSVASPPLWKRRKVSAPISLELRKIRIAGQPQRQSM